LLSFAGPKRPSAQQLLSAGFEYNSHRDVANALPVQFCAFVPTRTLSIRALAMARLPGIFDVVFTHMPSQA
jgi:hypothetical protein